MLFVVVVVEYYYYYIIIIVGASVPRLGENLMYFTILFHLDLAKTMVLALRPTARVLLL